MSNRKHNFSAGPSTLPLEVLQQAQQEFVEYQGAGMALIEMSHRGEHFTKVAGDAQALAMEILQVPDDFTVLFLQGGATLQFSMIPMNLLHKGEKGAYINSGSWAGGAIADGAIYGDTYIAWDGTDTKFTRMPKDDEIKLQAKTRYLHITSNETIGGVCFPEWPKVDVPLIGDMSSDYMSRPVPWDRFDLVYGGTQKNLGPSGMAVVYIRKSILEKTNTDIGKYLRYDVQEKSGSMYNTPPVFSIYMFGEMLKWIKKQGGIKVLEKLAIEKSGLLYTAIEKSDGYYNCPVEESCRSRMNVVFRLPTPELEDQFLAEGEKIGLVNLKGHRSVGGCRASIYNAMPQEGVAALADFMATFQKNNPK